MDVVSRKLKNGSCIDVACPLAVKLYNQNMGGVDLSDQMRKAYTCSRKSRTRWYMRLFWFFVDLAVVNAYILESVSPNHVPPIARTGRQKKRYRSQLDFRKQLVTQLIGDHSSRGSKGRPPIARHHSTDLIFLNSCKVLLTVLFVVVNIISVSKQNLAVSCVVTYICVLYLVLKSIILIYMFFEFFTQDEMRFVCLIYVCL